LRESGSVLHGAAALGVVAAVVTAAMVWAWVASREGDTTGPDTYVRTFANTSRPLEVALATGDGQAFAAMAMDPGMSRPEVYVTGVPEAAYRAQRPLAGYAAWALSLGQPRLVAPALAALFVAGQAAAVAAAAMLLRRRGARPQLALMLVALPPSLAALQWLGPEPLGLAFVLFGIVAWERRTGSGSWLAAAMFTLAGLTRETNLVVPMALGLAGLMRRSRPFPELATLALPGVAWVGWAAVVHARLDAWPWTAGDCRLSLPLVGLSSGAELWPSPPVVDVALLLSFVAVAVACVAARRRDDLAWVAVGFVFLIALAGDCVWADWEHFTRPLLPLYALGIVTLATPDRSTPALE
jgi:hypothetical protein